jgi:hypothetical protein
MVVPGEDQQRWTVGLAEGFEELVGESVLMDEEQGRSSRSASYRSAQREPG